MLRVLLDEPVPEPLLEPLTRLLAGAAEVAHVNHVAKSKKDIPLITAAAKAYEIFVTLDKGQLDDPGETAAIRRAGIHHVRFKQPPNRRGLGLAMAAVLAAMWDVVDRLKDAPSQRLVRIHSIDASKDRYELVDPAADPPVFWRGRGRRTNSRKK